MDLDRLRALIEATARQWGTNVRHRRQALDLTQRQLAELAGNTTVQTISKVEAGEIAPRDYLKLAIAAALATEVDALFPMPMRVDAVKLGSAA